MLDIIIIIACNTRPSGAKRNKDNPCTADNHALSNALHVSNSLGVATSSRPSVQLASYGVKLRFIASNPSSQVGLEWSSRPASSLKDSINAPLITIFIEWIPWWEGRRDATIEFYRTSSISKEARGNEKFSLSRLEGLAEGTRQRIDNTRKKGEEEKKRKVSLSDCIAHVIRLLKIVGIRHQHSVPR